DQALRAAPVHGQWWAVPGTVTHTFTHFRLELMVYRAVVPIDTPLTFWADPQHCRWLARRSFETAAVPSVMRKVRAHGLREQGVQAADDRRGSASSAKCRRRCRTASTISAGTAAKVVSRKKPGQPARAAR